MDALISSALEEICVGGPTEVPLRSLWATLSPAVTTPSVKSSLWASLLEVQTLRFSLPSGAPADPPIRRVEDAEELDLRVAADEHLRDCFLGLYDTPSSDLPDNQRRALERIALARANGITQSELAKEFGMEGNNFFYIVKKLESRGLIVRQQAVVKTREAGRGGAGEAKNSPAVITNLIYLYRYAKHLSGQQRIEINKEARIMDGSVDDEETDVGTGGNTDESSRDSVLVKDYLPAMKSVCDKLEEANSKVLVIADIKRDLGYSGRFGHRAWRNICHRLKDAGLVEEFEARVNGKVKRCLRLLKSILPKNFDSKIPVIGDNYNKKVAAKFGRRFQQTEQLVELAIDHQIYDMIDVEGTKGALLLEVCGNLGIDRKRNDSRLNSMFTRFGMRKQEENHKRTEAYRVWTPRNCNPEALNAFFGNSDICLGENKESTWNIGNLILPQSPAEHLHSNSEVDFTTHGEKVKANGNDVSSCFAERIDGNCKLLSCNNEPGPLDEPTDPASLAEFNLARGVVDISSTSLTNHSTLPRHSESGLSESSKCMSLTTDGALREQRILDRLQDEKFILRVELHRWIASLEKDKHTKLDRKTIDRILVRLQQQGHCKCVHLSVPVVTNCSSSRTTMVILHPSVQRLLPELSGEILDRLRSFKKNIRGFGSSRFKKNESVPVLNDVMRTQNLASSGDKTVKSETTHVSGFLLSKMVRTKLFHCFLWTYVSSLPGWDDTISPGTYGCTFRSFLLEEAKMSIPLELLLQIAGLPNKSDDILEKCKRGLRLSDLSAEEHKRIMDTQAMGKISRIFEILRRLKLIRLVHEEHSDDGAQVPCATFSHALEIRPYLEEPLSFVEMLTSRSADLRPRIRHDFIMSTRETVNEYWNTLEYCYAAADPKAASLSFPGSAVPEVFNRRSWASARVLSADQHSKILKRIAKDNLNEKISYADCEKIMKDLNVTLHQILSVYNDIQRQVSSTYHGSLAANGEYQYASRKYLSAPRKRKNSVELSPMMDARIKKANELSDEGQPTAVPEFIGQSIDDLDLPPRADQDHHSPKYGEDGLPENQPVDEQDDNLDNVEDQEPCSSEKCYPLINQSEKRKPADPSRFSWTDEADRNLVMQYARHRAALGARYQRVDWTKLFSLPAPPKTCIRRMAILNKNQIFRTALMKFCSMLSHRYAKHLEKVHSSMGDKEGLERNFRDGCGSSVKTISQDNKWDDFNDENVAKALEDVLQYKRMAKLGVSKRRTRSTLRNMDTKNILEFESCLPAIYDDDTENLNLGKCQDSARRSRGHKIHPKFTRLFNEGNHVTKKVHTALAVSNAVELLKLVFLSTSTASNLQNLMAGTLRRYSEHDLFAAFSYLREKKIMIGGNGGPFMLSQQFLQSVRKSPFPSNSGKRAARFCGWLRENENNLIDEGIHLNSDLECGDIFQLFALVSSSELSISPRVPEEGVGEAEDSRKVKRKFEDDDSCDVATNKKLRSLVDSELTSRREKGFPGIQVFLHQASLSTVDVLHLFADWSPATSKLACRNEIAAEISSSMYRSNEIPQIPSFRGIKPMAKLSNVSPWEAMADYSSCLMRNSDDEKRTSVLTADLFRDIYTEIQKAEDQGLSIEEISDTFNVPGEDLSEQIVDVLLAFRQVLKVNAFESIRIVDALYRSKYFLTSVNGSHQDVRANSITGTSANAHPISESEKHDLVSASSQRETVRSEHQVTILNCPEVVVPRTETHSGAARENREQERVFVQEPGGSSTAQWHSTIETCSPILPWVNGDGTVNRTIYIGLVRRVIGTVMQNPGILEDEIIERIDVLNPQSCRSLLKLMVLDNHIKVRKMHQSISTGPPSLLGNNLFKNNFRETQSVFREHFFANSKSATLL